MGNMLWIKIIHVKHQTAVENVFSVVPDKKCKESFFSNVPSFLKGLHTVLEDSTRVSVTICKTQLFQWGIQFPVDYLCQKVKDLVVPFYHHV